MPVKKKVIKKPKPPAVRKTIDYNILVAHINLVKLADEMAAVWMAKNSVALEQKVGDRVYGLFRKQISQWIHDDLEKLVYKFCCERAEKESLRPPLKIAGTEVLVPVCPYCKADWKDTDPGSRLKTLRELLDSAPVNDQRTNVQKRMDRLEKVINA